MPEVPVIELAGLSEAQKRAYVIADNKLALNAGWDTELLGLELGSLQELGFDLSLTGFSDDELAGLLSFGHAGLTDPDDVPEPPAEPVQPQRRPLAARPPPAALRRQHRAGRTSSGCLPAVRRT